MVNRPWLIIGSRAPGSLEIAYLEALERKGVDVRFLDLDAARPRFPINTLLTRVYGRLMRMAWVQKANLMLAQTMREHSYSTVIVFKGSDLRRSTLEECRHHSRDALWVNINPDDPLGAESSGSTSRHIRESLSFYDLYVTWSPSLLPKLSAAGCRDPRVLPFGFDGMRHRPTVAAAKSPGLFFAGAWDREREGTLSALSELPIRIYGYGWNRVSRKSGLRGITRKTNVYGDELSSLVSASSASINMLRSQNAASHNMRTFEIPAMGGLMITTRTEEQNQWFPEGSACLMYGDVHELREVAVEVLRAPHRFESLRKCGQALAQSHSYDDRAGELIQMIRERT